jgi:hypothetical protein
VRHTLEIRAGGTQEATFHFDVPAFVDDGVLVCARLFVGVGIGR